MRLKLAMLALMLTSATALAAESVVPVENRPAMAWFVIGDDVRRKVIGDITARYDVNFLDVFSCITLFAREDAYASEPLGNLFWLCEPPRLH
ncbi:MAG: hypothetical protein ACOYLQ_04555 [Hyphomicrobiaceae bacterium]